MGLTTLVLGATSLVGRFLIPLLEAGERPVVALSRRAPTLVGQVRWIEGDLTDVEALGAELPEVSTVFSLSPAWLLPKALPLLIERGARRVVAFSSTSRLTKQDSAIAGERAVAQALARAEDEIMDLCAAAGVGWTLLRPTLIYAEGLDGNVSRLAALVRRFGVLPLSGDGEGLRQPVHAADLARAALLAAEAPAARDRIYALPGGETLSYRRMCERIFEAVGRKPRIISVPAPVWAAAFALARPLLPGATAAMGSRMARDLVFDGEEARRDFGWSPRGFHPDFSAESA